LRLSFWGVRGSRPTPHSSALRHGGNTPCVEVRAGNQLLVFDAGTGLHDLARQLVAEDVGPGLNLHLFLTHYHWAHIQGLPLFAPSLAANGPVHLYGPWPGPGPQGSLGALLSTLFSTAFSPASAGAASSAFVLRELAPQSELSLDTVRIRTCATNHPGGALAYRIDHDGTSLVYAPDHEPGDAGCDRALLALARGADLLICDAQCHPDDLSARRRGEGHGSWRTAVELARQAGAARLVLFHHDPLHTDTDLDAFVHHAHQTFPATVAAAEGMTVELAPGETRFWARTGRSHRRVPFPVTARIQPAQGDISGPQEVHLRDISFDGAYFIGKQAYDVNDPLSLLIEVPSPASQSPVDDDAGEPTVASPLRLRGRVVRVEGRRVNGTGVGVGLSFSEPPSVDVLRVPGQPNGYKAG